jgi:hypothetical protein
MTSTQTQVAFGVTAGLASTAVLYATVPMYHDMLVWSWGLFGINLEALFG